jgi:hypothetical protein
MFLDAAEEKMLRAIVQSAVASAVTGCPFAGTFRSYRISAVRLLVNENGAAQVEARIVVASTSWPKIIAKAILAAPVGDVNGRGEFAAIEFGAGQVARA